MAERRARSPSSFTVELTGALAFAVDDAFGLSFYLYRRGGTTVVGHTGEQSGFRSFCYLDPASTTAVIGVLNTTTEARPESSRRGWDMVSRGAVELVGP